MPVKTVYTGKSWKEINQCKRELADHFSRNSRHFRDDRSKIEEATRHISWDLADEWALHLDSTNDESWLAFHNVLTSRLRAPRRSPHFAATLHGNAKRLPRPSVRDFASYLNGLQCDMPQLFDDEERSWRLWDGVLPEVRDASPLVPNEDTYDNFLLTLQNTAPSIPSRIRWLGDKIIRERSSRPKAKHRRI